ncbi:6617_t:CDS:2 [Paraglomus brasilianum]|uniref:6617_t:CDS:1 n=1 Tax=Paraglomus brasilianum TaxID=144538 RepID=A0A9N8Z3V3_9GLOM|nr:6617_t:CDS:2 [Paraglomus brasilianum]
MFKAADYNLVPRDAMSMLDFDVLYMLECNITHGYLHDYNLNDEFMDSLARQKKETLRARHRVNMLDTSVDG